MKLRNLFMAVVAGAAMLVGCNKEVDLGPAKLALDQTTLAFEAAGGSQTLNVTATRDWAVSGVPEWVALSATNGKAAVEAQPVKITVAQNAEYNRSATIVFTIGFARTALTINQAGPEGEIDNGDGTLENPFNVAGVLEYTRSLPADQASEKNVYFKGKISTVSTTFEASGTYGNATFYMVDGDGGESFYVFQTYYLGNRKWKSGDTDIKEGDEVIVCGKVVNYKGNTPETVSKGGSFIYSLNGKSEGGGGGETGNPKGTGTQADPFNVAAAIAKAVETGETATTEAYYIKGKVSAVSLSAQYKNGDLDLVDVEGGAVFKAFRIKGFNGADITGNEPIKVGDEVVVYGNIVNFKGNTPETTQGGKLISWNGQTSFDGGSGGGDTPGVDPAGTGTAADPFNVAAAIAKAVETGETATADAYYIKGKVAAVSLSAQYKNGDLDLVDVEGGAVFKAFRIKGFGGADITGTEPIKVGDEVVVYGNIVNYKGNTPETTQGGTLISWNGKTAFDDGGDEPGGGDQPGGNDFTSSVTWTDGSNNSYTQDATVNGVTGVQVLKLGTGSATGSSTLTLPAGSTKLTFYALSWKGKASKLVFKKDGTEVAAVEPATNDGLAGNPTYTITVSDSDKYTITFSATSTLTVETSGSNTRAALFAVVAAAE